jgi:hypothetical protein
VCARHSQSGQASAELVAVVPLLLVVALGLAQLVCAGWALVEAGEAARAAARAQHVGAPAESAARRSLPEALERAEVTAGGDGVSVRARAPALVPGLPAIPVRATASLDPAAGAR